MVLTRGLRRACYSVASSCAIGIEQTTALKGLEAGGGVTVVFTVSQDKLYSQYLSTAVSGSYRGIGEGFRPCFLRFRV